MRTIAMEVLSNTLKVTTVPYPNQAVPPLSDLSRTPFHACLSPYRIEVRTTLLEVLFNTLNSTTLPFQFQAVLPR